MKCNSFLKSNLDNSSGNTYKSFNNILLKMQQENLDLIIP